MTPKGLLNLVIILLAIIIIAVAGYFIFIKSLISNPNNQPIIDNQPTTETEVLNETLPLKAINCNYSKTLLSSLNDNVQSPLSISLSLASPCPSTTGAMVGKITTRLDKSDGLDVKAINITLKTEGNIATTDPKTYSISNLGLTTKDINLSITKPGMGLVTINAEGIKNNGDRNEGLGSSDSLFFLLTEDGDFLFNRSGYLILEQEKLTKDFEAGLINKSQYDQETTKLMSGNHTYICSKITCY